MSLLGDASKARRVLGWSPTIGFEELVREMVECDLAELQATQGRTTAEAPR
jgi:GDPmannose 4,6-dehydratase